MTVYRRYHELKKSLARVHEVYDKEIGGKPLVVVVWADPEIGRLWLFQELIQLGLIYTVLSRKALPNEGSLATSFCESYNIRLGLEYIDKEFKGFPVIFQTADVCPKNGTYGFIYHNLKEGNKAVLFLWENGCIRENVWHTNLFGLADMKYAPPLSEINHPDVLERQWGIKLTEQNLGDFTRWNNFNSKMFTHEHISEQLQDFPYKAQKDGCSLVLSVKGWLPWYIRLGQFIWRLLPGISKKRKR